MIKRMNDFAIGVWTFLADNMPLICLGLAIVVLGALGTTSAFFQPVNGDAGEVKYRITDYTYDESKMLVDYQFAEFGAKTIYGNTWLACGGLRGLRYTDCVQFVSNRQILYMLARGCIGLRAMNCEGLEALPEGGERNGVPRT